MLYVIDENVAVVANDNSLPMKKAPQADERCRLACVRHLKRIVKSGLVVLDSMGEVLEKYRTHLNYRGQPGVGDAFYKHLVDRQYDRRKVERVSVPKHRDRGYVHFPATEELETFDHSDRIYVALVLATQKSTELLNAVDSDYLEHEGALQNAGVDVREICPNCVRTTREA